MSKQDLILVGKVSGVFGIKGWLKLFSYTEPKENIVNYKHWVLKKGGQTRPADIISGQAQGKGVVAQLEGITDRESAQALIGCDIYVTYEQLPPPVQGEYYWADLIGLLVENVDGVQLGRIENLIETGANDVIIVKGEREQAIPFLQGRTVKSIDLMVGKMVVDWDADF